MIWDEFCRDAKSCVSTMRKIAGYLTKNRSGKDQKIAQSTHENGYIKPRKTFWRNSKQLLSIYANQELYFACFRIVHSHIACTDNLKEVEPRTSGSFLPRTLDNLEEVDLTPSPHRRAITTYNSLLTPDWH